VAVVSHSVPATYVCCFVVTFGSWRTTLDGFELAFFFEIMLRDTAYGEDSNTGYAGNGPQAMPRCGISPSACLSFRRHRDNPHVPGHRPCPQLYS
jgi:hypothetical protein